MTFKLIFILSFILPFHF